LFEIRGNVELHRKVACVRLSRPRRYPVQHFRGACACLKRKIEGSADGEARRIDVAPRRESWPRSKAS
jgi:hypothetical protein